jgi:hypothetical protein
MYIQTYSELTLKVDFRDCIDGEVIANGKCDVCVEGAYSLGKNMDACLQCPELMNCTKGFEL